MNIRKLTSLTSLVAFCVMMFTSIVLYVVPQGRVAYWADWRFWGIGKDGWGGIHINAGFLFILALIVHIYYNWKPIAAYLKNSTKQFKFFTKEFTAAAAIVIVTVFGTIAGIPPFSTVLDIGADFKERAAIKYGEPPYGHAELSSLKSFSSKVGIDLAKAVAVLNEKGIQFENENEPLVSISRKNNLSPKMLHDIIGLSKTSRLSSEKKRYDAALPDKPPAGTGNLKLSDIMNQYGLNSDKVRAVFSERGWQALEDMTLKEIASKNNVSSMDVYDLLKNTL